MKKYEKIKGFSDSLTQEQVNFINRSIEIACIGIDYYRESANYKSIVFAVQLLQRLAAEIPNYKEMEDLTNVCL